MRQARQRLQGILCVFPKPITKHGTNLTERFQTVLLRLSIRYSAAVGMAEKAADDSTTEFIFKRADEAMYRDKAQFKKTYGIDPR